jgi:hypothetical protein
MKFLSKIKKFEQQNFFDAFKQDINSVANCAKKRKTNYKPKNFQPLLKTKLITNLHNSNVIKLFKLKGNNPKSFWPWFYKTIILKPKYTNFYLLNLFFKYGLRNVYLSRIKYLKWLPKVKLKRKLNFLVSRLLACLKAEKYSLFAFIELIASRKNSFRIKDYYYLEKLFIIFRNMEKLDLSKKIKSKFFKKVNKTRLPKKLKKEKCLKNYKISKQLKKQLKLIMYKKIFSTLSLFLYAINHIRPRLILCVEVWESEIRTKLLIDINYKKFSTKLGLLLKYTTFSLVPSPIFNIYREGVSWFDYVKKKRIFFF